MLNEEKKLAHIILFQKCKLNYKTLPERLIVKIVPQF